MRKIIMLLVGTMLCATMTATEVELLNASFSTQESFNTFTLDEQPYAGCTYASVWFWKSYNSSGYANITVNQGGKSRGASDCKLVSPMVDASSMKTVMLSFEHTTYAASASDSAYLSVEVTIDSVNWSRVTIPTWPSARWSWTSCTIDISAYASSTLKVRFRYVSTATYAATWEVKDVRIYGEEKVNCPEPTYTQVDTVVCDTLLPVTVFGYTFTEPKTEYDTIYDQNECPIEYIRITLDTVHCENPEGVCRYEALEGLKSTALLDALHDVIADHTVLSYDAVRADKAKVDVREDGTIWDLYSNCNLKKTDYCVDIDQPECTCHNREHMLPKSWWGGSTSEPMYTDLHHVIPTDYVANETRSAWIYDEVTSSTWTNGVSKLGSSKNFSGQTAFEPADEYKGDVARVYFYMITCYKDKSFTQGGKGWKYFNSGTAQLNATALNLLLKWHRNDSVSQKEIDRNNKVENKQGNRNPFVDDPGLAEYIWGSMKGQGYVCHGEIIKPDTTDVPGAISCQVARDSTLALASGSTSADEYIVQGYVTQIKDAYSSQFGNQSFWMADKKGGGQVFLGYRCNVSEAVNVGDKVAITGKLTNYNSTPEMKFGQTQILLREQPQTLQQVEIQLDDTDCRVFNMMGQEVTAMKEHLPRGIYILYKKGRSVTIVR